MAIPVLDPSLLLPALIRPTALFVNLNGVLAPIAAHPEQVRVAEPVRASLRTLARSLDLVAVVSGAPALLARAVVGVEGVLYLGNHGSERIDRTGQLTQRVQPDERLLILAQEAVRRLGDRALIVEAKGAGAAIHWRSAKHPRQARKQLLAFLQPGEQAHQFRLVEGRCLIELRPLDEPGKGGAVAALLAEYGVRGALYLGDDRSDLPAFAEVQRLRQRGGFGIALAVANEETPAAVTAAADFVVAGVPQVAALLDWLANRVGNLLARPAGRR